jgi:O-antigen/teichoic acid export membrane protein
MSSLKANAVANFVGTLVVAVVYLLVLPIYLKLLGADAFGILGIFFSLSAICAALDLGLGVGLSREMARLSIAHQSGTEIQSVLRTYEVAIWCLSGLLGVALFLLFPLFVDHWLQTANLNKVELKVAFNWMALGLALQLTMNLYINALLGLQKQIVFNTVHSAMVSLRLLGAAMILWVAGPNLIYFFAWQTILLVLHLALLARLTWNSFLPGVQANFVLSILARSRHLIFDVAISTLLATILTHLDKILLSKIFSLRDFGFYMIAWSLASVVGRVAGAVYVAWLPRLTQYIASADVENLKTSYFQGLRLILALVLPVTFFMVLFPKFILETYTQDTDLTQATYIAMIFLSLGSACNAILFMPHALALAHSWTRLALIQNGIACILAIPLIYFAAKQWGLNGAGGGWLVVNALLLLYSLPLVQRCCLVIPRRRFVFK